MSQPGFTVMLKMLFGDEGKSFRAHESAKGKTVKRAFLAEDGLILAFTDGSAIRVFDDGQSCCEHRYMTTDDDLPYFEGAIFLGLEVNPAKPDTESESKWGDVHEISFLDVRTSKGVFTLANHNEHNGYYGGFSLAVEPYRGETAKATTTQKEG